MVVELRTFIQWKGTDLCMDLWCECGHHSHIDGYFAYHVRCSECGAVYRLPDNVGLLLRRAQPEELEDDDLVAQEGPKGGRGVPWEEVRGIPSFREARETERSS